MRKELTIEETQEIFDNEGEVCFYMGQKAFLTGQGLMVRHLDGGTEPMQGLLIDFIKGPRWIEVADKPACELPEEITDCLQSAVTVLGAEGEPYWVLEDKQMMRLVTALHRHWQEQIEDLRQVAKTTCDLVEAKVKSLGKVANENDERIAQLQAKVERMENHYHPMSMDSKLKMAGPSYPTSTAKED